MEFINSFKNIKKTEVNLYTDLEEAWCEYEYIKDMILHRVLEIIENDQKIYEKNGFRDTPYCMASLDDLANIIIIVKPAICTATIHKIEKLLGTPAIISIKNDKKNPKIRLKFSKFRSKKEGKKNDE